MALAAAPKAASTVVLLRDGDGGELEVFLVQRHGSMGFMGGLHVFPGGKVSLEDAPEVMRARVEDAGACIATHAFGDDIGEAECFGRAVAAVRETFEEASVLFAPIASDLRALRAELLSGSGADFGALLDRQGLRLSLDALVPLSRWITPETEPVRFDTSFYVARLPEGQVAEHDRGESIAASWFSIEGALAAAEAGEIRLAPPTARTLETLLGVPTVEDALERARRSAPPVILPILRMLDGAPTILYPGDPEHPVKTRALPGETRRVMQKR